MECLKVLLNNEAESKEAQELFSELGYRKDLCLNALYPKLVVTSLHGCSDWYSAGADVGTHHGHKEITLMQLRDMVVLKRNSDSDATHIDSNNYSWFIASDQNCYHYQGAIWVYQSYVDFYNLKPIEKPVKEYLTKMEDCSYKLVPSYMGDGDIEIPECADLYVYFEEYDEANFYKGDFDAVWQDYDGWYYDMNDYKSYCKKEGKILWSRSGFDYDELDKQTDIRFATGHNLDIFGAHHSFRQRVDGESDQNYREELLSFAKGYLSPNNESKVNKEGEVKMKSVVHKYPIPFQEGFELNLPKGSKIVRVDTVDGFAFLWALHEVIADDTEIVTYKFASSKTGGVIEHEKPLTFVGTYAIFVQMELMLYVFLEDIVDTKGNSIVSEYNVNQSTCWRG